MVSKSPTPPENLREACVAVALEMIGQKGVESLSIREVARRLGVSHQAPYKHFPSADHLLAEIVRRSYALFSQTLEARLKQSAPGDEMQHLGEGYLNYALEHPLHYRLMFGTPLPNPEQHPEMMQEARSAFLMLLKALAIKTHTRPSSRPSRELQLNALFVWATVHGLSSLLQTAALSELGLTDVVLSEAIPHTLRQIGNALAKQE